MVLTMKRSIWIFLLATLLSLPALCPAGATGNGSVTCPTSGAKQIASTGKAVTWLIVQSVSTNAGNIYFGGSAVSTSSGVYIIPGGSISFPTQGNTATYNLASIYFACATNTDSLTYTYQQ